MKYVPVTPAGTVLDHLQGETEQLTWDNLLEDLAHMPYPNQQSLVDRGYTVEAI